MIKGIDERRVILHFEDVALLVDPAGRSKGADVRLSLLGGELALIRVDSQQQGTVLGDTCAGLEMPLKGDVSFLGKN